MGGKQIGSINMLAAKLTTKVTSSTQKRINKLDKGMRLKNYLPSLLDLVDLRKANWQIDLKRNKDKEGSKDLQ